MCLVYVRYYKVDKSVNGVPAVESQSCSYGTVGFRKINEEF